MEYVREDVFDNWPPPTPEEKLMRKEDEETFFYTFLSCLTSREIKTLCLLGKLPPLNPIKIKCKCHQKQ